MYWCPLSLNHKLSNNSNNGISPQKQILPIPDRTVNDFQQSIVRSPLKASDYSEPLPIGLSTMIPAKIISPNLAVTKKYITEIPLSQKRVRTICPEIRLIKCDSLSGALIPNGIESGRIYNIATIQLDSSKFCNYHISFNFACNIMTRNATITLNVQLIRQCQGYLYSIPISANYQFTKIAPNDETNSLTFSAFDHDPIRSKHCTYNVLVTLVGTSVGDTQISNSILTALIETYLP